MPWNYCGLTEYSTSYVSDSGSGSFSNTYENTRGSTTNVGSAIASSAATDGDGGGETQGATSGDTTYQRVDVGTIATFRFSSIANYLFTSAGIVMINETGTTSVTNGYLTENIVKSTASTSGTDSNSQTFTASTLITNSGSTNISTSSEFVTYQVFQDTFGDPVVEYTDQPVYYDSKTSSATLYTSICSTRTITTSVASDASTEFFTSDQSYTASEYNYDTDSTLSRRVSTAGSFPTGQETYDVLKAGVYTTGDCPTYRWDGVIPEKPFYVVRNRTKTITGGVQSSTFGRTTTVEDVTYNSGYKVGGSFPSVDLLYSRSGGTLTTNTGTAASDTVTTTRTANASGYRVYITSSTYAKMLLDNLKTIAPAPVSENGWGFEQLQVTAISPRMPKGFIGFGNDEAATSRGVYESITFDTSGQSFSNVPTAGVFSLLSFNDIGANASINPTGPCALPENNSSRSLAWDDAGPEFATASNLLATHASTYKSGATQTLTSTAEMVIGFSCITPIGDKDAFIDFVELVGVFSTVDDFGFPVGRKLINSYVANIVHNDDLARARTLYFNPGKYTFTKYGNNTSTVKSTILVPWASYTMPDGEAWGINKVDIEHTATSYKEYYRGWNYTFPPNPFLG